MVQLPKMVGSHKSSDNLEEETKQSSQEPIEAEVVSAEVVDEGDIELGETNATGAPLPVASEQQEAVPLTPRTQRQLETSGSVPAAAVANVPGIVVERIKERPRQCCAGFGCFVVLVTFLIAFLFIPRAPNVRLQRVDFSSPDLDAATALRASVKFTSRTLVEATWRRLDVDLDWYTEDSGTVDVASLSDKSSFRTKAFGSKDIALEDVDSVANANLNLLRYDCRNEGSAMLRVRGHIRTDDTRFAIESEWRRTTCS